ncbi:hypothetical protein [Actinomycetospora sp. CA-053990]|uniref:hypothetical protein n=1 Tax=Actinomycetospora sp. CA-053990 TaxID=3239891 RepID=UPI003D90125B
MGLRAVVVANFELSTARAIVQFTPPTTFAAIIFVDISIALSVLFGAVAAFYVGRLIRDRPPFWIGMAGLLTIVAILLTLPMFYTNILIVGVMQAVIFLGAVFAGIDPDVEYDPNGSPAGRRAWYYDAIHKRGFVVTILAVVVLGAVATRGMWLAPEALVTRSQGPITVFVLSETPTEVVYYERDERGVLRMPKSNIIYRQFCSNGPEYSEAEFQLGASVEPLPLCPPKN